MTQETQMETVRQNEEQTPQAQPPMPRLHKKMKCVRPFYNGLFYIVYILFAWAVRMLFPTKATGRQHLPKGRGYVLACNHLSAIDPLFILVARGLKKKMMIMGKEELFQISPILNWCWKVLGCFPIDRGAGNREVLDQVSEEVQHGRGLLLFPEGTRSKDGNLGRLKSGAFVVAWEAGADLVPCSISYTAGKPKLFKRINVVFGPPVTLEELGLTGEYSAHKLRDAKRIFTERLETLAAEFSS